MVYQSESCTNWEITHTCSLNMWVRESTGEVSPVLFFFFLVSSLWVVKQSGWAMKRRGYQVAHSATSTNHNPTRWNEFIIDVDFQTICRDEGASSQRVPEHQQHSESSVTCPRIWSRPRCDHAASARAELPISGWPSGTACVLLLRWLTYCSCGYFF